jgi:type IV pilus assembly protein PilM
MGSEIVGLKIGASQIAAARVVRNGAVELTQVAQGSMGDGIVQSGEVRDVPALATALKEFFKANKLPKKAVRVGISNNRIGVRTVDIIGIDDPKQLANAVRFRAQEVLPIPLGEAVLDYQMLSESVNEEGQPVTKVLLVVAYRDLVDAFAAACKQAGIRLVGIDLEAFALLRVLAPGPAEEPQSTEPSALVAVSIGSERSTLAISEGLACEYTRVLDWGGAALTGGLARALDIEMPAAERLKRQLSLEREDVPGDLTPEQALQAREALQLGLQGLARELVSSLQFYQGQPGSLGIREVVLVGGTAKLDGLAAALERFIGVSVRVGDPFSAVSLRKQARTISQDPALAVAIGLGMGT